MLLSIPMTAGHIVTCGREEHQSNHRAFASLESVHMLKRTDNQKLQAEVLFTVIFFTCDCTFIEGQCCAWDWVGAEVIARSETDTSCLHGHTVVGGSPDSRVFCFHLHFRVCFIIIYLCRNSESYNVNCCFDVNQLINFLFSFKKDVKWLINTAQIQ